jgi:hypothetical protein
MAITSKINIDIDSAAFAAFQDKFDKYKAALDKTPAAGRGGFSPFGERGAGWRSRSGLRWMAGQFEFQQWVEAV